MNSQFCEMNRYPETFIKNSSYKQEVTKMRYTIKNETKQKYRHIKSAFLLFLELNFENCSTFRSDTQIVSGDFIEPSNPEVFKTIKNSFPTHRKQRQHYKDWRVNAI